MARRVNRENEALEKQNNKSKELDYMSRATVLMIAVAAPLLSSRIAEAHCQVPCGIFADQHRFEEMLEDTATIAKAIAQINDLAKKQDALSQNQLVRWVVTKESHAANIQEIVAQYFMAQRIKSANADYVKQLTAAHAVIVAAMKCKQNVDAETANTLKAAIFDLYRAYEGKEPNLNH